MVEVETKDASEVMFLHELIEGEYYDPQKIKILNEGKIYSFSKLNQIIDKVDISKISKIKFLKSKKKKKTDEYGNKKCIYYSFEMPEMNERIILVEDEKNNSLIDVKKIKIPENKINLSRFIKNEICVPNILCYDNGISFFSFEDIFKNTSFKEISLAFIEKRMVADDKGLHDEYCFVINRHKKKLVIRCQKDTEYVQSIVVKSL